MIVKQKLIKEENIFQLCIFLNAKLEFHGSNNERTDAKAIIL